MGKKASLEARTSVETPYGEDSIYTAFNTVSHS